MGKSYPTISEEYKKAEGSREMQEEAQRIHCWKELRSAYASIGVKYLTICLIVFLIIFVNVNFENFHLLEIELIQFFFFLIELIQLLDIFEI